jgi:hypothetical protein
MRDDFSFLEGAVRRTRPKWWIYAPIVGPTPKVPIKAFALAEYPLGFLLHFTGRDVICTGTKQCPGCKEGIGRRWKGFLPATGLDQVKRFILPVTEEADNALQQLRVRFGSIMSQGLLLSRKGDKKNAPVVVSDLVHKPDQQKMPAAFDVRPQVLATHGYDVETIERLLAQWETFRLG